MPIKTFYLNDAVATGSSFGQLTETDPGGAVSATTGWKVGTTSANRWGVLDWGGICGGGGGNPIFVNTDQLTSVTAPGGSGFNDCLRTESPLTGTFANTNWTFTLGYRAVVSAGSSERGLGVIRVYRSANADGSGSTQLTSGVVNGTATTTGTSTSQTRTAVVTWSSPGTFTFNNEYLFIQIEWKITAVGASNNDDMMLYTGAGATTLVTPNFSTNWDATAVFAAQGTLAADSKEYSPATALLASTSTLAADSKLYKPATALLASTSTLAAGSQLYRAAQASLPASSTLSAASKFYLVVSAALPAQSTLAASVSQKHFVSSVLAATSSLAANALEYSPVTAVFTGQSALSTNTLVFRTASAILAAQSALAADAFRGAISGTALWTAQSTFVANVSLRLVAVATLNAQSSLAADSDLVQQASAVLAAQSTFSADSLLFLPASASLAVQSDLAADGYPVTFLIPDFDDTVGTWTNELGGAALSPSIDEAEVNDSDYIQSISGASVDDTTKIRLSNPSQGGIGSPMMVSYRFKKQGTATANLRARLLEGNTEIAAWQHDDISASFTTIDQTLTAPQIAAIGDPSNLYIELRATV